MGTGRRPPLGHRLVNVTVYRSGTTPPSRIRPPASTRPSPRPRRGPGGHRAAPTGSQGRWLGSGRRPPRWTGRYVVRRRAPSTTSRLGPSAGGRPSTADNRPGPLGEHVHQLAHGSSASRSARVAARPDHRDRSTAPSASVRYTVRTNGSLSASSRASQAPGRGSLDQELGREGPTCRTPPVRSTPSLIAAELDAPVGQRARSTAGCRVRRASGGAQRARRLRQVDPRRPVARPRSPSRRLVDARRRRQRPVRPRRVPDARPRGHRADRRQASRAAHPRRRRARRSRRRAHGRARRADPTIRPRARRCAPARGAEPRHRDQRTRRRRADRLDRRARDADRTAVPGEPVGAAWRRPDSRHRRRSR